MKASKDQKKIYDNLKKELDSIKECLWLQDKKKWIR